MKVFIKICFSVIRKNKGFSIGIFIMSLLSVAIAFLGANFGASSSDTIMNFLYKSKIPDAIYTTDAMPADTAKKIEDIKGVRRASFRLAYDTDIETADGTALSVRMFKMADDSPLVQTIHEQAAQAGDYPEACISSELAEYNKIRAGDCITVSTPYGEKAVFIKAVVSNPETIDCVKDRMSMGEEFRFGYLYISEKDFGEIMPESSQANQWLVYFDEGLPVSEQKQCMEQIRGVLGEHVVSESLTEESRELANIRGDLDTIRVLCLFIPGIIWLISLGFNFIFIRIITEDQRKSIGLLRALGFSTKKVVLVFIAYTVIINLPAAITGGFAGSGFLNICLGIISEAKGITETVTTIVPGTTALVFIMVFVIGIAAALLSAGAVAKVDPGEAYDGHINYLYEPFKFVRRMRKSAFFKISAASALRNFRRQITGALCITACVISICVGLEGMLTVSYPAEAIFGNRYRYDLMVRDIDSAAVRDIKEKLGKTQTVEPFAYFSGSFLGENVNVATTGAHDVLTVLTDAEGSRLRPEDGIIIDEMCAVLNGISVGDTVELDGCLLTVTGIAREIFYMVMYVSPETAAKLGHGGPNGVLLGLSPGTQIKDIKEQVAKICENAYFTELSDQKENTRARFKAMSLIMLVFSILAFCIGSLLVINITIIDFNENRKRYAILRALGVPAARLCIVSLAQNLFRVLLGIILAWPLCYVCVTTMLKLLSGSSQQYVMVDYIPCMILSCLFPLFYILFGILVSLRKIKKLDFCKQMNGSD